MDKNSKNKMFFLVFLPITIIVLAACLTSSREEAPGSFTFFERKESVSAGNSKGRADLSFYLIDTAHPVSLQNLLKKILYKGNSAEEYSKRITENWKKEFTGAVNSGKKNSNWSYEEAHSVFLLPPFAVIKRNVAVNRGSVRPVWQENYFVLDLSSPAKQIVLKNIFTREGLARLFILTDRELRRFSRIKTGKAIPAGTPLSRGIYSQDKIAPSENFYPAENGLNFMWNSSQIAPNNEGAVEISVGWNEIAELLSPKGKELSQIYEKSSSPPQP
jgi:hypothetical protein